MDEQGSPATRYLFVSRIAASIPEVCVAITDLSTWLSLGQTGHIYSCRANHEYCRIQESR
jgi:hypothetical protein